MVDATAAVGTATQQALSQSASTGSGTAISSDFETFLKMLTVQMQNQDPLNPIESSDYAVQLATFSGVEQQVLTNDLLTSLGAQLSASGMADMASWVGMEARAVASAQFDGTNPVTLAPNPVAVADRAEVVVRDAWGTEVQRFEISVTDDTIEWDGTTGSGTPLPTGSYSFELESYSEDELLQTDAMEVYQTVREIRSDGINTILVLQSGAEITSAEVTALRDPSLF